MHTLQCIVLNLGSLKEQDTKYIVAKSKGDKGK